MRRCDVEALLRTQYVQVDEALLRTQYVQVDEALSRWGVVVPGRSKVGKIMRSTSFSSCVCAREAHRARLDERRPCARCATLPPVRLPSSRRCDVDPGEARSMSDVAPGEAL